MYIYIKYMDFSQKRASKTVLLSVLDENLTKLLFSLFSKVLVGTLQRLQKSPKWAKTEKKEFLTKVFLMFTFLKESHGPINQDVVFAFWYTVVSHGEDLFVILF